MFIASFRYHLAILFKFEVNMKETLEIRINYDYAHLLFNANEGKALGMISPSVLLVEISKDDSRYYKIPLIEKEIEKKYNRGFYFGWEIKRKYTRKELDSAELFHMQVKTFFEPTGECCGTEYDESVACNICGANGKQITPLFLKRGKIPKKDIAETIGSEIVVSERFMNVVKDRGLKGCVFSPVMFGNKPSSYYQLTASKEVELSSSTVVGINPFNLSGSEGGEVYNCPNGDTIGLNLLSEPHVLNSPLVKEYDFLASRQKIGVRRGVLRPSPVLLVSPAFRKMVEGEKLTGFKFEIARLE